LEEQAAAHGGSFEQDAAELLAEWTQEDPRLASQELRKLLDYVDLQRAIRVEDIEQCTPYRGQTTIFALVDALGQRRGEEAQKILHQVLQDADVRSVFGMIIRQFRLILLAKDLMDSGKVPGNTIHKSDFVVKKVSTQARNFTLADLERIYHELLAIDLRSKNGEMDLEIALDSLVSVITS
jgi:DNA polymerase-3 subunit delta